MKKMSKEWRKFWMIAGAVLVGSVGGEIVKGQLHNTKPGRKLLGVS